MMIAIIQRRSAGKPRESHRPIGPGCVEVIAVVFRGSAEPCL
jgi:hypothetical protein